MEQLTNEELEKQYRDCVSYFRYYINTDDIDNWNREEAERNACRETLKRFEAEYARRAITKPIIK